MNRTYDDIIDLPHHVSATRPQMPAANRAAQFSPFAALTGYESAIKETARLTDRRIELDENMIADLDMKLSMLADHIASHPKVTVTHFRPDESKEGGAYIVATGPVKKIDGYEKSIVMMSDDKIMIGDIIDLEGDLFRDTNLMSHSRN